MLVNDEYGNNKFFLVNHPLVESKISMLRDKNTGNKEFRELVEELAGLIFYESTRDLDLVDREVETPIEKTISRVIEDKFCIVPILRAGIGMANGIIKIIPNADVGHIGLYRDPETLEPVEYYCKLPSDISERKIFLTDPMLATGGTASAAIRFLEDHGASDIKLLCLIAAPEGISKINKDHPEVEIYVAECDKSLNSNGYIVPGLGDAGDRLFGTK